MIKINQGRRFSWSYLLIVSFVTTWALIIFYPFYNSVIQSITPRAVYIRNPFVFFPKGFTLDSYKAILLGREILVGYRTTAMFLFFGLPLNMFLTSSMGFCLAKRYFPGKRLLFLFIIITMFFQGGLIPLYLVVRNLGLMNSIFSVIFTTAINTFYLILTKNYFESIPISMEESAMIDGANDLVIFFKIYLPLAKPILATICLFYAVDRWNEWFLSMLFLRRLDLVPLQIVLRNIVTATDQIVTNVDTSRRTYSEGLKMAAVVITMLPVMVVYPFLQKYFMKGIMMGAVKS